MTIKDLIQGLNLRFPERTAEEWDNVGLLVGAQEHPVERVFLALDATEETIAQAAEFGAALLITHHPMIFSGIKKINTATDTGRKILTLIQKDMACYAMHTNYDICGMAKRSGDLLGLTEQKVLSMTEEDGTEPIGFGRVGKLPREMTLAAFGAFVRDRYQLPDVRIYGEPETRLRRAAVCTGSGKSFWREVLRQGAQVYVTGDVDYHTALDAMAEGLCLIDAGHYGTEYIFMKDMEQVLGEIFPQLKVGTARVAHPYQVI